MSTAQDIQKAVEAYEKRKEYGRNYYHRIKQDPVKWAAKQEYIRNYRKNRAATKKGKMHGTQFSNLDRVVNQRVRVFTPNYIYTGTLTSTDGESVCLHDVTINGNATVTPQQDWFVQKNMIESWGVLK